MNYYNPLSPVETMSGVESIVCQIPAAYAGMRLDQVLAALLPSYSRSLLQQWIRAGHIQVNGRQLRPRDPVAGGEQVQGIIPQRQATAVKPQAIPLVIHYEDADLFVLNKPAGLVVHPAAGNSDGTLVNALLHYAPELATLPRAGLVHRLDKDTSGLLVVARSQRAHTSLVAQLQARTIEREYQAVVSGRMTAGGTLSAPIGRHPGDRKRMAVVSGGKAAVTHYRVMRRFINHTQLWIKLETGRTHQIRVHMAYLRYPLVGDPVYGGRCQASKGVSNALIVLRDFPRQALHATRLAITHPTSGQRLAWQTPLPADMAGLLSVLEENNA
jgi:23S rRNA pseudouridine1911/1915/1917 synthase